MMGLILSDSSGNLKFLGLLNGLLLTSQFVLFAWRLGFKEGFKNCLDSSLRKEDDSRPFPIDIGLKKLNGSDGNERGELMIGGALRESGINFLDTLLSAGMAN
jgi:hypothetical protein